MKIRIQAIPAAIGAALCLLQPCLTQGQSTLTNNLVAHLKFEDNYVDEAGNVIGAGPVGSPKFEAGLIGKAIHMVTTKDGATNDYVTLGYPDVLKFGSDATGDATDFSFAFWVKVSDLKNPQSTIFAQDAAEQKMEGPDDSLGLFPGKTHILTQWIGVNGSGGLSRQYYGGYHFEWEWYRHNKKCNTLWVPGNVSPIRFTGLNKGVDYRWYTGDAPTNLPGF